MTYHICINYNCIAYISRGGWESHVSMPNVILRFKTYRKQLDDLRVDFILEFKDVFICFTLTIGRFCLICKEIDGNKHMNH